MLGILLKILIGREHKKAAELYQDLQRITQEERGIKRRGRYVRRARKKAEEEEREERGRVHYCKLSDKQLAQQIPGKLKQLTTDIHDLQKIKEIEVEIKKIKDSGKELSWSYLHVMRRISKMANKMIKETEKKKEKRRREEEIKKYGKH